jgi:hypothetical protein
MSTSYAFHPEALEEFVEARNTSRNDIARPLSRKTISL